MILITVRRANSPPLRYTCPYDFTIPQAMAELPSIFAAAYAEHPDAMRIAITIRNSDHKVVAKLRYGIEAPMMES